MKCETGTCNNKATNLVNLSSPYVNINRGFCETCRDKLCAPQKPGELQGTDLGEIASCN